eukprot:scaffold35160_cov25-Phaeocystis_antarctica.AAC.1
MVGYLSATASRLKGCGVFDRMSSAVSSSSSWPGLGADLARLAAAAGRTRLEREDGREHRVGLVLRAGDVGVIVQAEYLGPRVHGQLLHGQLLDHLEVALLVLGGDGLVVAARAEGVGHAQHVLVDEVVQLVLDGAPVPGVRHAPAVVDLRGELRDHLDTAAGHSTLQQSSRARVWVRVGGAHLEGHDVVVVDEQLGLL